MSFRKSFRRFIAFPVLQPAFRMLYRLALAGMNYGGAASASTSGDVMALRRMVRTRRAKREPLIVFDVGANEGSYVEQALNILGEDVFVYAFEPSKAAFSQLHARFQSHSNVRLVTAGMGATTRSATLWSSAPGSVLASTYVNPISDSLSSESIELVPLDGFCEQHAIARIDLLKIDVEGGELDVLRGAARLLEAGSIAMIQFEFGQPSLGARTYFVDLFQLLTDRYKIYRVLPNGLVLIPTYHETFEVFMSTNYLAVARTPNVRVK